MSKVICFANMKGGVGKTTLCVNLSFALFRLGKKVLVVDNDPQFNATTALVNPQKYIKSCIKGDTSQKTTFDIYEKPPRIKQKQKNNVNPDEFFMKVLYRRGNIEIHIDLIPSRIELYDTLRNPSQKEYMLDKFLERYAQNYDFIMIDCPPTPSVLTFSAFAASDYVIIPVMPDYFSTLGLPQFLRTLSYFKEDMYDRHNVKPLGVVFTNVERKLTPTTREAMTRVSQSLNELSENIPIFDTRLSHFKVFEKAIWQSEPVHRVTGRGTRGKSLAIAELNAMAEEMQNKIKVVESS